MKIRLMVSEEHYAEIADWLTAHGAEIDDSADLILSEKNVYAGSCCRLDTTEQEPGGSYLQMLARQEVQRYVPRR